MRAPGRTVAAILFVIALGALPGAVVQLDAQSCQPAILDPPSPIRFGPDAATFRVQVTGYCNWWSFDAGTEPWLTVPNFEFNGDRPCRFSCTDTGPPVVVAAGASTTVDFGLAPLASISGTLTDAGTGAPLTTTSADYFSVQACNTAELTSCGASSTDAQGRYTIDNLTPGTYYLKTLTPDRYIDEVYNNTPCEAEDCRSSSGAPVAAPAGVTTTIDFALALGGRISGTLRRADTNAPAYRQVSVYNAATSHVRSVYSDFTTGQYTVTGLPSGSYYVTTGWYTLDNSGLVDEVYPNVPCFPGACRIASGAPVTVTAGATTSGIDFSLDSAGAISGRVTDSSTGAAVRAQVSARTGAGDFGASTLGEVNGQYTLSAVLPGRYYVSAVRYNPDAFGVYCFSCAGTAVPVTVASGQSVTGVDLTVADAPQTGRIRGTFSHPLAGWAYGAFGGAFAAYDGNGRFVRSGRHVFPVNSPSPVEYVIDGLAPGTYYVRFEDPAFFTLSVWGFFSGDLIPQVFSSQPCVTVDCDVRRGVPVIVTPGGEARADFSLQRGAVIGANQVDFTSVFKGELYDARGVRVLPDRYRPRILYRGVPEFAGLPAGTYYYRTSDGRLNGNLYCPDCPATAGQPIVVGPAGAASVSVPEATPHRISGTVRESGTNAPLSTIGIEAFSAGGESVATTRSDAIGQYLLENVPPGTYYVRTRNNRGYADRLHGGVACAGCDPLLGTPVVVGDADVTDIDFALPPAALVRMTVTDPNGVALGGQAVTFFDSAGLPAARYTSGSRGLIDANLPVGVYYARTEPASGRVQELYEGTVCAQGTCTVTDGTAIQTSLSTPADVTMDVAACAAPEVFPSIVATAVAGRAYRQVLSASGPSPRFQVVSGRLPNGLTLDAATGVLSGTPAESGVFNFTVAALDTRGCAGLRTYTLQVAQCAFALNPSSATVGADGATVPVSVTDACGYTDVTPRAAWIAADVASAAGASSVVLTIAPNSLAAPRTGTITIGRRVFTVRQAGRGSTAPFGVFETPINGARVAGSIAVTGWALDDVEVTRVRILRDPVAGEAGGQLVFLGNAVLVRGARPDVERAYPSMPQNDRGGWGYLMLTSMLPNRGNGVFRIHAIADDAEGQSVTLGTRTIVCANSSATLPFGAIDTPAQGETVSGSAYPNFGWALTPLPKAIPTDGSTIRVVVDGVSLGPVTYNLFRTDVASLFPGLANSGGAIGHRALDTTALAEGVHTIAWGVTDSDGAAEGIGSRYFTVSNSADAVPAAALASGPESGRQSASLLSLEAAGARAYRMTPLQQLEVSVADARDEGCEASYAGYLDANGDLRDLPVGATLRAGVLRWQPGPAFRGRYAFQIIRTACDGTKTTIPVTVIVR